MSKAFTSEEATLEVVVPPRAPLPPVDTAAPARFLPAWDATLLVNCRRTQILPEEHRPKIFHVNKPQSEMTFVVDGAVAGTWRFEDGRVRLDPFRRLRREDREELEEESERLLSFLS